MSNEILFENEFRVTIEEIEKIIKDVTMNNSNKFKYIKELVRTTTVNLHKKVDDILN